MKFSIGIAAYKPNFLKECIDSIINQTFVDFELIILNDASPYDIYNIVLSYNDKRIRYYENKNNVGAINVVDNWNKCLHYAKGEYYIQMGDDDILENNYLEEFNRLIQNYPLLNIYHCRSYIIDEKSLKYYITDPLPTWESLHEFIEQRLKHRIQYVSDFVYKTCILKQNGGFYKLPLAWGSDDITSFIAAQEKGIAHINKPIFCYRKNRYSITSTGNIYIKKEAIESLIKWIKENINKETNCQDNLYIKQIKEYLPTYYKKQQIYQLNDLIRQKGSLMFFYSIPKLLKKGFDTKTIVKSFITHYFNQNK